jgi:hypothetical protein
MAIRPLSDDERALIEFLLSSDANPGAAELRRQAATVRTTGSSCDCGCPSFGLTADRAVPAAPVDERVVAEAHGHDPGGNAVGVLLFVTEDGYLDDLEVFGYDTSDFAGLPLPESLKLTEWSEPDENGARTLLNP